MREAMMLFTDSDSIQAVDALEDADAGVLLKALMHHAADDDLPVDSMPYSIRGIYIMIRGAADRSFENYDKKRKERSEAGKKSGEARRNKYEQTRTNMNKYEQTRTNMNKYEQVRTSTKQNELPYPYPYPNPYPNPSSYRNPYRRDFEERTTDYDSIIWQNLRDEIKEERDAGICDHRETDHEEE